MISLKKMIVLYVEYELSDETWDMLRMMSIHGLISRDKWSKFFDKCKGWHLDEDEMVILDDTDKPLYVRDVETGRFVKL